MPALIRSVGRLVARRLLDERLDPAVVVGGHDAEARRVLDRCEGDGALAAVRVVERHERADVEVGEHVAVDDEEALVDAGVERRRSGWRRRCRAARARRRSAAPPRRSGRRGRRRRRRRAGSRATARPRDAVVGQVLERRARSSAGRRSAASASAWSRVSGRSRVPNPPTRTTALTRPPSLGRGGRGRPARRSVGRGRRRVPVGRCRRASSGGGTAVGCAPSSVDVRRRPTGRGMSSVPSGTNASVKAPRSSVKRTSPKSSVKISSGSVPAAVGRVLPVGHDQLAGLAAAGGLAVLTSYAVSCRAGAARSRRR